MKILAHIPLTGQYPWQKDNIVPCSDGAGTILTSGSKVTRFKPGEKVLTLFNQAHLSGPLTPPALVSGVGGMLDGTLRQYGVFSEAGLVAMPSNLSFLEGATLPCAGVTAWNTLFGAEGKKLKAGQTVLTLGSGGVSCFALLFAKAVGARVICTTSSEAKAEKLRCLGADHVINYTSIPSWGEEVRKLTNGDGVDHVVETGGPSTFKQSLKSVKIEGVITVIGFIGGPAGGEGGFMDLLGALCTVRSILVGSREVMEEMCHVIEEKGLKPVVDERVFGLEEAREAYGYLGSQGHFGKVVVRID